MMAAAAGYRGRQVRRLETQPVRPGVTPVATRPYFGCEVASVGPAKSEAPFSGWKCAAERKEALLAPGSNRRLAKAAHFDYRRVQAL